MERLPPLEDRPRVLAHGLERVARRYPGFECPGALLQAEDVVIEELVAPCLRELAVVLGGARGPPAMLAVVQDGGDRLGRHAVVMARGSGGDVA
jgi:hypothetical protein